MDPETYLFVYLDLDMITSTSTPTRLYQFMLRRMAAKVQDEDLQKQIRDVSQLDSIDTYRAITSRRRSRPCGAQSLPAAPPYSTPSR